MTVLERQRARSKWQQEQEHHQQEHQALFCGTEYNDVFCSSSSSPQVQNPQGLMMMMMMMDGGDSSALVVKPDPGLENGWPESGKLDENNIAFVSPSSSSGFDHVSSAVTRTCSSPRGGDSLISATEKKMRESFKKRKAENPKVWMKILLCSMLRVLMFVNLKEVSVWFCV